MAEHDNLAGPEQTNKQTHKGVLSRHIMKYPRMHGHVSPSKHKEASH